MIEPPDQRQSAPAALRNREPILDVLRTALPETGRVLEIASGTGEHIVHFARHLPALEWQPSDLHAAARASIVAWTAAAGLSNISRPLDLDVCRQPWPVAAADAILCINMVHISPWSATEALMAQAGRLLPPNGLLYLYGPFFQAGIVTAPGNIAFDTDLRDRNREWGLRDLAAVAALAEASELAVSAVIAMPANNLSVLFRRR